MKNMKFRKCILPCVLSTTLLAGIVMPVRAKVYDTFKPIKDLQFTSEVATEDNQSSENEVELKTDIKYADNKSSATMTITAPEGYELSLTDNYKNIYKEFLDDKTVTFSGENTKKLTVTTTIRNIYNLELRVKNDNYEELQYIGFKALDIRNENTPPTRVERLQDEENVADAPTVTSETRSTVTGNQDSQSMTVTYTSPGAYSWSIPSEIDLNSQQTLTVSANKNIEEANASLKIKVSSANDFKLVSDTGKSGKYSITKNGNEVINNSTVLETSSAGTASSNLKFNADSKNFITAGEYNDSLTFTAQTGYTVGAVLNVEGYNLIVMSQIDSDKYLVISGKSIGNIQFQPNVDANGNYKVGADEEPNQNRPDTKNSNTYEGSYIDNYLENVWYNKLSKKLKDAICSTKIQQISVRFTRTNSNWSYLNAYTNPISPDGVDGWFYNQGTMNNPNWVRVSGALTLSDDESGRYLYEGIERYNTGYSNEKYNELIRHIYLPSIDEISNLVNLNSANKIYEFLNGTNNFTSFVWLRDSYYTTPSNSTYLNYSYRSLSHYRVTDVTNGVRPAFVIDLSKVDATVVDTVHYR